MPIKRRVPFLDIDFDPLDMAEVVARLGSTEAGRPLQYVVTPNVDHVVRFHRRDRGVQGLHVAYRSATLCLCDSRVLGRLARWCGLSLPVVTGSDLTGQIFRLLVKPGDRIAIVGGDSALATMLKVRFPALEFMHHQPPQGLASNPVALDAAAAFVARQHARFSFIAVGSPQQELIALRASKLPEATGTALCIGAALQFLVGQQRRAPRLIQRAGLEWAFRLASQPTRMWRRYVIEGPRIFLIAWRWRRAGMLKPL